MSTETHTDRISLSRIYYPVTVLGPGNRVGIWMNGCDRRCPGCVSPEMQTYDAAKEISIDAITDLIGRIRAPIDGFTISGGEPFFRPAALNALVLALSRVNDDILIFTGCTLEELRERKDPAVDSALGHCAALVDGPYVARLNDCEGLRGSSNQRIHVFRYPEKYRGIETAPKKLQTVVYNGHVLTIGIPKGGTPV